MAFPTTEGSTQPSLPGGGDLTRSGAGLSGISSWAEMDRQIYGTRFNLLLAEGREDDITYDGSVRSYKVSNNRWNVPSFGSLFTVPDHLPGSENRTTAGGGSSIAQRGGLICRAYAQNATVEFGIRKVVLDGTGGLTSAGSWNVAQTSHTPASSFSWDTADNVSPSVTGYLLYPSGIAAGDLIQLYVAFRVRGTYSGTPAYLAGYEVFEPNLINANP